MMTNDIASSVSVDSARTTHSGATDDYFKALYQRNVVLQVDQLTQSFDQGGSRK